MHLGPNELGPVKPRDLMGAVNVFNVLYRDEE